MRAWCSPTLGQVVMEGERAGRVSTSWTIGYRNDLRGRVKTRSRKVTEETPLGAMRD